MTRSNHTKFNSLSRFLPSRSQASCLMKAAFLFLFVLHGGDNSSRLHAETVSTRGELVQVLGQAGAGTRVLIAPGTYQGGFDLAGLRGTESEPIVIAALDPDDPPVFDGGASGFHLSRCSYVELRNLVFTGARGNGLNLDDGGNAPGSAHHIVLSGLQVRDVGPTGNRDGIKLSGIDQFVVENCLIERWGNAGSAIDMVGCHQGQIRGCRFRYQGDMAANGVQTKGGSSEITIERCRFENAGSRAVNVGGSTGRDYFRPRDANYEARNITVEDCTFIGSAAPIAMVGVDGAWIRYNTIYRPERWVIRILQESQGDPFIPCRNGKFTNNVIVFDSDQIRTFVNIGVGTQPESFRFADNFWYCRDNPQRSRPRDLPVAEVNGTYGQDPRFVSETTLDLSLADQSPVRNAGARPSLETQTSDP